MEKINITQSGHEVLNFIGNEWVKPSGDQFDITSPYTGNICGKSYNSTSADIDKAISIAKTNQVAWGQTPLKARTAILFKFRNILLESISEIAAIIALENGKTIPEASAGIMKGVEVLEYALSLQNADVGGRMEVSRGVYCEYKREALGVVASITPFNFPAMVPMWTIPIAIACGNAYVWKPSEKTPLTSKYITDAFAKAGLPTGILTVIQGDAQTAKNIIEHKDIQAVAFVGSTKVANIVYTTATAKGKRALCLGGAKNHIILLPDADLDVTGVGIADSFTGCAGQRCMAASVLLAVGDVQKHIDKIKVTAQTASLGDNMGAIITREQVDFLNEAIERAVKDGATLLLDGRNPEVKNPDYKDGHWIGPTILDNVKAGSEAAKLELFGPIIAIIRCENISQAIKIQNSSEYGNAASVFTSSGPMAQYVAQNCECGMFGVNIGVPVPREPFSFGGTKESKFGHGDITGEHSLNFWSNVKKITTKWEQHKDHNWMS